MNLTTAIALFKLFTTVIEFFQKQTWYQQGREAVLAEINAEQEKRIAAANAARADADALSNPDRLRDQRD